MIRTRAIAGLFVSMMATRCAQWGFATKSIVQTVYVDREEMEHPDILDMLREIGATAGDDHRIGPLPAASP